jgi:molybdate transport system substrate-binding protein
MRPARRLMLGIVIGLCAAVAAGAAAHAADIRVLCAGAMRGVVQQLAPQFEKSSGNKLVIEFGTAGQIEQQIRADQPFDVAILTKPRADKLIQGAFLVGGGTAVVASAQIGLAVKQGAPHPDIGTVDAFKAALLRAKSVAYVDPATGATSGVHLAKVLDQLGIAAELKPKLHLVSSQPGQGSPRVGDVVAQGEAELGMQPISELMGVKGIDIVGPLPAPLQTPELTYSAGLSNFTAQPSAAQAFIDFLAGPAAQSAYKANGLQPH